MIYMNLLSTFSTRTNRSLSSFLIIGVGICAIALVSWYHTLDQAGSSDQNNSRGNSFHSFSWSDVTPTKDLRWQPCFNKRECARLLVPLDHHNPGGKQAALAMIRVPSKLGPQHPDYRGPILINPGGPGGSGVWLLAQVGDLLAKIVGPRFDLVSFDPRGVGASLPRVSFYKSNFARLMWNSKLQTLRTPIDVSDRWALMRVINAMVRETDNGELRYINTDQTARDMLSIVHAHGRDKLQFWGFSYGTVLGVTFAAMFPDKVERLVIDGVLDAEDYYDNMWLNVLIDTEKGVDAFVSECHKAGHIDCAFWAPQSTDIRQNMTMLFDNVRHQPVPVVSPSGLHGVVDIDTLEAVTFFSLYKPYARFPILAEAFAALAQGDGSIILSLAGGGGPFECPAEPPLGSGEVDETEALVFDDAQVAISCNDGTQVPSDLESSQKYIEMYQESFPTWGLMFADVRLNCIDWPRFPKTGFRGPFNATTSHPLLVVGNTADPVTPLWAAKKMSAGFTGSVVLTQDSPGHSSNGAPSTCTQSYIRRYFIDGTLPEPGTVCSPDTPIFGQKHNAGRWSAQNVLDAPSAEEQEIYTATQEISMTDALRPFYPSLFRKVL
ncbi:TAP-like protein-domain-containing protein [Panaeolus papilionaceus]|nr:TAP-like protein-domain-containing protein [Panaeolus papilionaceus]